MAERADPPEARIWVDGCFDLFHFGHANAIRQAKAFGNYLFVGIHTDEDIETNKGPTVIPQPDRYLPFLPSTHSLPKTTTKNELLSINFQKKLINACRWVNETITSAPYVTSLPFLAPHQITYVVHGDDITTDASGYDTYRLVKDAGIYRECKRTEGVSTTDAISRVLFGIKRGVRDGVEVDEVLLRAFVEDPRWPGKGTVRKISPTDSEAVTKTSTLPTPNPSHTIALVSPTSPETDDVVYIEGPFDLFSPEDVDFLESQTEGGKKKVVVGIWSSADVEASTGSEPVLSFQERVFGVLQCRHVHGVVIPAAPISTIKSNLKCRTLTYVPHHTSSTYAINRIEARRTEFEERQKRKEGKSVIEAAIKARAAAQALAVQA